MPKNTIGMDVLRHPLLIEELTQDTSILGNRILTLNTDISFSVRAMVIHNMSSETPLNADTKTVSIFTLALILSEIQTFKDNHFFRRLKIVKFQSQKCNISTNHFLLNLYSHPLFHCINPLKHISIFQMFIHWQSRDCKTKLRLASSVADLAQ